MMIPATADKTTAIAAVEALVAELGLQLGPTDYAKPWGAYFYIDPSGLDTFVSQYFPNFPADQLHHYGDQLQPKHLLVESHKRLSWQYHHRRGELWRVVQGPVGAAHSPDDTETEPVSMNEGETIRMDAGTRHRLSGLDGWGLVAEIWQHTDPAQLSDEADIVRVADDFSR